MAGFFQQGTPQARAEAARRLRLRQLGIEQAQAIPGAVQAATAEQVAGVEQGFTAGSAALRQQAAQALGAGISAGGLGGGAALAAGRQSALDVGAGIAGLEAQRAERVAGLQAQGRLGAAQAQLEATQFEAEAGSEFEDAQSLIAGYQSQVAAIIERHKSNIWGDDEEAMAVEISALARVESNPVARQWLLDEAEGVQGRGPHGRDV